MENVLSQKVLSLQPSATIAMAQKARELISQGKNIISLSLGEPDFDTPDAIKTAAKKALDQGYTKYTPVPGLPELRDAICHKFQRDNDLHYNRDNIMVSNGAKQCIANVCLALLDPGDEVILLAPYWVSYEQIAQISGGEVVKVLSNIESDFKVNITDLKEAITDKTKLIIFSSPCNPTGSVYTERELQDIAQVLRDNPQVYLISDEIYEYINYEGEHASIASFEDIKDQIVLVNGLSKAYSMTGWRLGYMAANAELITACSKVQGQFTSGANAFGQKAAVTALNLGKQPGAHMYEAFQKRKNLVRDLLSQIPDLKVNDPKGAFYFFPDVSAYFGRKYGETSIANSTDLCEFLLEEAGVATVPGVAFGDDRYIRLSYATSEAELKEACTRMKNALAKLT